MDHWNNSLNSITTTATADTFKDNMVLAITQREQDRVDAERHTKTLKVQVEDLSKSFEHLNTALEGRSLDEAMHTVNMNEEECFNIMTYVQSKEIEVQVENEMADKFIRDIAAYEAAGEQARKKAAEMESIQAEALAVEAEKKRMDGQLVTQTADAVKWAAALNNVFKSLSIDLETLGVQGGRITEESDLAYLMGIIEEKAQQATHKYKKRGYEEQDLGATEAWQTQSSFLPPVGVSDELEMPPPPDGGEATEAPMSSMDVKRFLTSSNDSFRSLSPDRRELS